MFLDGVSGGGSIGVLDISLFWLLANNSTQASCNGTSTLSREFGPLALFMALSASK